MLVPAGLVHSGVHTRGLPEQPVVPAALKAYRAPLDAAAYTTPSATAGGSEPVTLAAVHKRAPAVLTAYSVPPASGTYTTPFATAGVATISKPLGAKVHSGLQAAAPQPAALKAATPLYAATYTFPPDTAGTDPPSTPLPPV